MVADATRTLPPIDRGLLLVIVRLTHWLLYALLIITVALGFTNVWVRGDTYSICSTCPPMIQGTAH